MTSKPVTLGPLEFPTQTAAKEYMSKEILNAYEIGERITDQTHIDVIEDILSRKDNAAEKVGNGIDYFYVGYTRNFKSYIRSDARTLVIHHTDSSEEDVDFGYTPVITGAGHVDLVKIALRLEAESLRDAFKFSELRGDGPWRDADGLELQHHAEAEVRYRSPNWSQLTRGFAMSEGGWDRITLEPGGGKPQIGRTLADRGQAERWQEYYRANARPVITRKK